MPNPLLAVSPLLLLLAVPAAAPAMGGKALPPVGAMQHIVISVPRITASSTTVVIARSAPLPPPLMERKADDCVKMKHVVGAAITTSDSVDFMLDNGKRLRAKLGADCPALSFYSNFYVRPRKDGKMCAKRDSIRSRSGAECQVLAFRSLVPAR